MNKFETNQRAWEGGAFQTTILNGKLIVECMTYDGDDFDSKKIGLLISSSPEMYELLKGTLHLLYNEDETTLGEERNKMYLNIRRFIDKLEKK